MHTVELLELALATAQASGYRVRRDWLAGQGGGACTIRGQKWLFVDLASDYAEQLEEVVDVLRNESAIDRTGLPEELAPLLTRPRAA